MSFLILFSCIAWHNLYFGDSLVAYADMICRILEYMEASRSRIEMEIKELRKLYKWEERVESCLSIETSKRMRHKFRKLMQKYSVRGMCFTVLLWQFLKWISFYDLLFSRSISNLWI